MLFVPFFKISPFSSIYLLDDACVCVAVTSAQAVSDVCESAKVRRKMTAVYFFNVAA